VMILDCPNAIIPLCLSNVAPMRDCPRTRDRDVINKKRESTSAPEWINVRTILSLSLSLSLSLCLCPKEALDGFSEHAVQRESASE